MQKKYFKAWRAGVGTKQENEPLIAAEAPTEKEESPDSSKGVGPAKKEVSFLTVSGSTPVSHLFAGGK